MSDPLPFSLEALSAALSNAVAAMAPSVVGVHSHRSLSSGFLWRPGLIVTSDEALAEEGEVAVTFPGGERRPAIVAWRDALHVHCYAPLIELARVLCPSPLCQLG